MKDVAQVSNPRVHFLPWSPSITEHPATGSSPGAVPMRTVKEVVASGAIKLTCSGTRCTFLPCVPLCLGFRPLTLVCSPACFPGTPREQAGFLQPLACVGALFLGEYQAAILGISRWKGLPEGKVKLKGCETQDLGCSWEDGKALCSPESSLFWFPELHSYRGGQRCIPPLQGCLL